MKASDWPTLPPRHWIALGVIVVLTRLAFLGHGYGSDPDAWRAVMAGRHLAETGHYLPSRPPGYPLPEYVLALLVYAGIGTPWVTGFVSAVLSGLSTSLMALVCAPLGRWRAAAASLALALTPVVFIASLSAMDYIWGLTFFLAATLCVLKDRWAWAAIWLGLAAASRPTYALCFIPLAWAGLAAAGLSWRSAQAWRRLILLALLSGSITVAFFVPAIIEIGWRVVKVPPGGGYAPAWLLYSSTALVFGLIGSVALALTIVVSWWCRRDRVPLPDQQSRPLSIWAWLLIGMYALLFFRLPDEASYLMPALLGLYCLLARYSPRVMLGALAVAMLVSSFYLSIAHDARGHSALVSKGPVLREFELQQRRACVAGVIRSHLANAAANERIITAEYRPQLMVELGRDLADRVLYTVTPADDGRLVDTEAGEIPAGTRLMILDRAVDQQSSTWAMPQGQAELLETKSACP